MKNNHLFQLDLRIQKLTLFHFINTPNIDFQRNAPPPKFHGIIFDLAKSFARFKQWLFFSHFSGDFATFPGILWMISKPLSSLNTWRNSTDLKQNTKYKVNIKSISIIYQYRVRKHNLHPLK